jgi:hypothetical protein
MKLQIGKSYRTRSGLPTPPLEASENGTGYTFAAWLDEPEFPGSPSRREWTECGAYLAPGHPHRLDIVEEVNP